MANKNDLLNPSITTSKETIRKNIRHALTTKSTGKYPTMDTSSPLFECKGDLLDSFLMNFRACGGKYISCTKSDFSERLNQLIKNLNFFRLLNTYPDMSRLLSSLNIPFQSNVDTFNEMDAAVVYAHLMIASTGALMFSQKYTTFPTVKNLAKNYIIIALADHVVPDMKSALEIQKLKNNSNLHSFSEFIIPSVLEDPRASTIYNPLYILMLVR